MCEFILNIVEQSLIFLPLAIGAYLIISLMKIPNLSLQSAFLMGAICGSKMVSFGQDLSTLFLMIFAIVASLIGGSLVGLASSLITQFGRIPHLLSSIITSGIFYGVFIYLLNGAFFSLTSFLNPLEMNKGVTHHPELIVLLGVGIVLVLVFYLLFRTQLGYSFAIYGDNPAFFEHYKISTSFVFIIGSLLSNGLAGLSGYLFAQSSGFVDLTMGNDIILLGIIILILGKSLFYFSKSVCIFIPLVGIIFYCFIQHFIVFIGLNLKYFSMIEAVIILGIVIYKFRKNPKSVHSDQLGV